MPPKSGDGGRSTANSSRSLFAKEKIQIQPSGGAAIDKTGNRDVQDTLFQSIPPSGGDVTADSSSEQGQDQDIRPWSHADDQLVRGASAQFPPPFPQGDALLPGSFPPVPIVQRTPPAPPAASQSTRATFNGAPGNVVALPAPALFENQQQYEPNPAAAAPITFGSHQAEGHQAQFSFAPPPPVNYQTFPEPPPFKAVPLISGPLHGWGEHPQTPGGAALQRQQPLITSSFYPNPHGSFKGHGPAKQELSPSRPAKNVAPPSPSLQAMPRAPVAPPAHYQLDSRRPVTPEVPLAARPDRSRLSLSFRKKQVSQRESDARRDLEQRHLARGRFDRQERRELASAEDIGAEARSQDTDPGRAKTRHGYDRDGCASTTDEDLQSSSSDEDDTESCEIGSDASSTEADDEPDLRREVVDHVFAKFDVFCAPSTLEIAPITINRDTGRTDYMLLLLNNWISPNASIAASQATLFLKLLKLLPQECQREIFAILVRSIKKRSEDIFLFLFHCVRHYLPTQIGVFKAIIKKNKRLDAKSNASASPLPHGTMSADKKKPKPTVPKPTLRTIEDIHVVTFQFYNEYLRYKHDHEEAGYAYSSLFGCLTPDQQAILCDMCTPKLSIVAMEALDIEGQLDIFRALFGLKSSAAVIDQLSTLDFEGDALDPAAWAIFRTRFTKILNLSPRNVRPPELELAKRFIYACPLKMLKNDVQSRKTSSLAGAMEAVLNCLSDPGFLRSVASKALIPRDKRDRRPITQTSGGAARQNDQPRGAIERPFVPRQPATSPAAQPPAATAGQPAPRQPPIAAGSAGAFGPRETGGATHRRGGGHPGTRSAAAAPAQRALRRPEAAGGPGPGDRPSAGGVSDG